MYVLRITAVVVSHSSCFASNVCINRSRALHASGTAAAAEYRNTNAFAYFRIDGSKYPVRTPLADRAFIRVHYTLHRDTHSARAHT